MYIYYDAFVYTVFDMTCYEWNWFSGGWQTKFMIAYKESK